ncbi:MAG: AAA family ATPase, partial [Enterococcus sp.]|nr:AAA family ATPase [Enterococcus sp.]
PKGKPVYYLSLEGNGSLPNRVKAWQKINGGLPTGVKVLSCGNFTICQDDIKALAEAIEPNSVIFIDTLNRALGSLDENSTRDAGIAINLLTLLQTQKNCLIVLIHHTGKDTSRGLRGSSAILGAIDTAIELTKHDTYREWKIKKSKDGEENLKGFFDLKIVDLGFDADGDNVTSCVIEQVDPPEKSADMPKLRKIGSTQETAEEALRQYVDTAQEGRIPKKVFSNYFYEEYKGRDKKTQNKYIQRGIEYLAGRGKIVVNINDPDWLYLPCGDKETK